MTSLDDVDQAGKTEHLVAPAGSALKGSQDAEQATKISEGVIDVGEVGCASTNTRTDYAIDAKETRYWTYADKSHYKAWTA